MNTEVKSIERTLEFVFQNFSVDPEEMHTYLPGVGCWVALTKQGLIPLLPGKDEYGEWASAEAESAAWTELEAKVVRLTRIS
jgi:hypothetical protein